MARGPLYLDDYRPQFSGHETFPLRYGWLKKAYDALTAAGFDAENKSTFLGDDAIAYFGVGKNMVASMRHWANAAGVVTETQGSNIIQVTPLGKKLFGPRGVDPYLEHPSSLWLLHWQLAARPEKTTWFWAFNHFPALTFEREQLCKGLERLAKERAWSRVAAATIKNDVACFVRTYVAQQPSWQEGHEDGLESPLTELGLIKGVGKHGFRFVRGPKSTLGDGVFTYALLKFWSGYSKSSSTLSFEAIAHEPGGPGRTFLLDENDVVDRLVVLDRVTDGVLRWSETAGLKQIVRNPDLDLDDALRFVDRDYADASRQKAA